LPFDTATVTTLPVASTFHAEGGPRPLPGLADGSGDVPSAPEGTLVEPPAGSTAPSPTAPVGDVIGDVPLALPVAAPPAMTPFDPGAIAPSLGPFEPEDEMLGPPDDDATVMSVGGDVTSVPLPDAAGSGEAPVWGGASVSFCGTTVAFEIAGEVALEIISAAL